LLIGSSVKPLKQQYLTWYEDALEVIKSPVYNTKKIDGISRVVVAGMGGSGIVGDVIASVALDYDVDVGIHVVKDFYVPKTLLKGSLLLAISYSGNTVETINALKMGLNLNIPAAVVTSGGALLELAERLKLPYVKVKAGLAPRAAMPHMLYAALILLDSLGLTVIPRSVLEKSLNAIKLDDEKLAKASGIARFLYGSRIPLVVSSLRYSVLAVRLKNELNENSKMPCKVEIAPELFHNDIVGWEGAELVDKAIIIQSDDPIENEYLNFYSEILRRRGLDVMEFTTRGDTILERLLYGFHVAGIASVDLAEMRGFDPLKTESIAEYKHFLKNRVEPKLP